MSGRWLGDMPHEIRGSGEGGRRDQPKDDPSGFSLRLFFRRAECHGDRSDATGPDAGAGGQANAAALA